MSDFGFWIFRELFILSGAQEGYRRFGFI